MHFDPHDVAVTTIELTPVVEPGLSAMTSASLSTVLSALRWGALLMGLAFAADPAIKPGAFRLIIAIAIVVFLTSWRTISPLELGKTSRWAIGLALFDVVAIAAAISPDLGLSTPLVGPLLIAVAVAGFGWGIQVGAFAAFLALATSTGVFYLSSRYFSGVEFNVPGPLAITALAGAAILPGVALERLHDIESRRLKVVGQRDKLKRTNELLVALTDLARTLPSSLDMADVVATTRTELMETFGAKRLLLLSYEDGKWSPLVQDGFNLPPELTDAQLPPILRRATQSPNLLRVRDLTLETRRGGSGMYARLIVRNADAGLIAIEHDERNHYRSHDAELLAGMTDVLALTLSNARAFNRLRSLAAAEERSRIARDLHDRLGQYLTYIALELERINRNEPSAELSGLHGDVQGAIGEFRDTLLELRTAVSAERPLRVVLGEVIERFSSRSKLQIKLVVPTTSDRLPARIENEFLRIAQEGLTNIEKHAMATKVHVAWSIADGRGTLVIQDDGRGFDTTKGIRGSAYGLVGMRERAASVGALLNITSKPGHGTAITVQSSQNSY